MTPFLILKCYWSKIARVEDIFPVMFSVSFLICSPADGQSEPEGSGEACARWEGKDGGWKRKVVVRWWDFYDVLRCWSVELEEEEEEEG